VAKNHHIGADSWFKVSYICCTQGTEFMNKILLTIIALFVLSGMFSCKQKGTKTNEKPPVKVNIIIAEKANFTASIEVNGSALSEEMIELHPEISGRLIYLNIPDGASVTAGTVLAKINDADLQAQLEQQRVQLDLASKTEERLRKLLAINGVNQSEYDASLSQVNAINANINILNAELDKTIIKAAFSGILGLRMVSPGAYVTPQTILGTLQQVDKIKIDFTVPETYTKLVAVGNAVYIKTNDKDEILPAVISAIEPQINADTRNIKARARLKNGYVSPGTFVKVILIKNDQRIVVPSNAIIPNASSNQVIVIKNNKAQFVNVETGLRNADAVELLSGINSGDSIVVSGVLFVRPNASVIIGKVVTNENGKNPESNAGVK
jgi:membrane fusion protein (multidrug efflux system)